MSVVEASFEDCFREHYACRLRRFPGRWPGHAARDLTQEAFARLHTHWERIQRYDSPGAWLRRVVANLAIDRHRSRTSGRRAVDRLRTRTPSMASPPADTDRWARLGDVDELLDINVNTVKSAPSKNGTSPLSRPWSDHEHDGSRSLQRASSRSGASPRSG